MQSIQILVNIPPPPNNKYCILYKPVRHFLVRRDESPENYCHSPGVVVGGVGVGGVVVRRQKL